MKKKLLARALRYLAFVNVVVTFLCATAAQAAGHKAELKAGLHFGAEKLSNLTANVIAKPVTGKVTDEKGSPLIGVSVTEQGTRNSSITDVNGAYSISVTNDKAVFSICLHRLRYKK